MYQVRAVHVALLVLGVIILIFLYCRTANAEGFVSSDAAYQTQLAYLNSTYGPTAQAKRTAMDNVTGLADMPPVQQNFINFFALACRYPSYIGPMTNGYVDADIGVQAAVQAGCRVFVLDIDYLDDCDNYFPRLVVRDIQGKLMMNQASNQPFCQSPDHSNLVDACQKISTYAFADSCPQAEDPLVLVLYFLRQPPGSYKSKAVLDYFAAVATALAPFQDRMLTNELDGGTFYRQKQEGRLLINPLSDYNGKVLVFSNANTTGFRENTSYPLNQDLDYMTHLRLSYSQTKMGLTDNESGTMYGILQAAEDFMSIPADRTEDVVDQTKLRWTICLPRDPLTTVPAATYASITGKLGVNAVAAPLFDPAASYLFTDATFRTYGFVPKPEELRYIKPPVVTPAHPNPSTNANQGMLRAPTL